MSPLEQAAKAYAEAERAYVAAYAAWRKAHPDEGSVQDQINLPSWHAEVQAQCRAVNEAMHKLEDAAMEMFP